MSYIDALKLTVPNDNWDSYTVDNETDLTYTLYIDGNSIPDYYYSDAPTDTSWSTAYTGSSGLGVNAGTFTQQLNDGQADLISYYLSDTSAIDWRVSFADVSNLQFHDNNSPDATGQIFVSNGDIADPTAFGITDEPNANYSTWAGDVVLDDNGSTTSTRDGLTYNHATVMQDDLDIGQMGAYVILHELGHAVGLIHPEDVVGGFPSVYTSQKYTIMTADTTDTSPDMDPSVHPTDLQLFDIAVLQSMYGVNWGGIRGDGGALEDTIYSKHTAFLTDNANGGAFVYTIWDGAGVDVIDATGYATPAEIDLRQGHFSSIGYKGDSGDTPVAWDTAATTDDPDPGNVAIAYFTVIENAIGTGGADILIGNAWGNILFGNGGNDQIYGDGLSYDGVAGDHAANTNKDANGDVLSWGPDGVAFAADLSGNDVLIGGANNDILYGGLGNDVLDGGYNKSDIDSATSGWATYWDSAGEITGTNNYNGAAYSNITVASDGADTADYSKLALGTSYTGISATFSDSVDYGTVVKGTSGALGTDKLFSIETVIGTAQNDTFNHTMGSEGQTFYGGAGSDGYHFSAGDAGTVDIEESNNKGIDTLYLDSSFTATYISAGSLGGGHDGVSLSLYYGSSNLLLTFSASTASDGYGVEFLNIGGQLIAADEIEPWLASTEPSTYTATGVSLSTLASSIAAWESSTNWNGGTGGVGAGGGTLPLYDGSGNVTGMEIDPAAGGSPISAGIADVIDNPMVITSFSQSFSGGTYTASASWATYEQAFDFNAGISASDVRLTLGGSQGASALTISIDSIGYSLTISNFETGQTINGIEVYNSTLHGIIQDASSATLTSSGTNTFGGSYLTLTGLGVNPSDHVTEHYYLESLNFAAGGGIDLTAPITFTGTDSADSLTGIDGRADIVYGLGGNDNIYSYGGDDTLIGGAGNDYLYGGTGNDTYIFAAGWGADNVHESTGEGTDTIRFSGIAPSDIRMYTDAYGYLHLVQISDPSNTISVFGGITGSNTSESTIGSYVESVTFDSSYATTWDLTGGLNLTGDNSGDYLYGTAYGDTLTGGSGADYLYGNAGNDTLIGGAGSDQLYGGPGNDTYSFSTGFGNATIHESTGQGTDAIHFTGIAPSDIRMYTDAYGALHLVQISNPSHNITVSAGLTGNNTSESTIGLYAESVTFDSIYGTTWDLTGGLTFTADNSNYYLYGTAYGDTLIGGTGADYLYGNAGNDTLIGGAGNDQLYGGPGDDTYVFSAGFANATIHESTGQGTDNIHFTGIDPGDIRMWTDSYGTLYLQDTLDPSHQIAVNASVTGSNTSESTIGLYAESVTFDSGYSTTWDLTGGLKLTGDNSGDSLYGTAYNDVITGGTGADSIYGNGGNDSIVGGTGNDQLYGGPGDDTYIFSSGFGNATIHESLSQGTDTVHLSGIDPANVRLYTDSYGCLHIVDSTNSSHNITINAGTDGSEVSESTAGSYVESITFDSGYSTTWDLTGGLTLTGDNSGTYLYGTAYGDTITGGTGSEYLYGNAGNDTLYGAGGNDHLVGGTGADTFLFKAATALTGIDTITDFNTGQGDKIDIADVISTYDPATMAIANFVQLATSGSDTQVKVDTDGSGTSYQQIATIQGVTGLSLSDLITDGNLIVHHT